MGIRDLFERCREFFWRSEAVEASRRDGFGASQPGWPEFALARITLAQGDSIRAWGGRLGTAALVYRSAARLMIRAHLARAGQQPDSVDESVGQLGRIVPLLAGTPLEELGTEEQLELLPASLGPDGESFLAQLPSQASTHAALGLRSLARRLGAPLAAQARGPWRALGQRWLRTGLMAALACALLGFAWRRVVRVNLARDGSVTIARPDATLGVHPELLVDGDHDSLGVFIDRPRSKTVTIDLGSPRLVSRVVVYQRPELENALPIDVSIGDSDELRRIARRQEPFEQWTIDIQPTPTRYVRLASRNKKLPLHLTEVEVY